MAFVVTLVNVVLMPTIIIIINHPSKKADKLTKTDMCKLWFNGISKTVTMSGLTFEQIMPDRVRYEKEY